MKKSRYQHFEKLGDGIFLHHNAATNCFLVLNDNRHQMYEKLNPQELKNTNPDFFNQLVNLDYIIDDERDELSETLKAKESMLHSNGLYNVVINTTLDCNLKCWYCYERRVPQSHLSDDVIRLVTNHISYIYDRNKFQTLKVSFFGGEPFMDYKGIHQILEFSKSFCNERGIELIADFTTNATLITADIIQYLKQFRCHFQITLDGGRLRHNQIKVCRNGVMDTYQSVLNALQLIDEEISNRWVAVRINFDNQTLKNIDEIINDISFLDCTKSYVILKKIWQLKTEDVDRDSLMAAIDKFFTNKFLVDYYVMPKGDVCFAERENQILFNYDGKIFKCTTISDFNDDNSLGTPNESTGEVIWNKTKTDDWYRDMQPDYCKECHWFPSCLGICNRQIMAHHGEKICTFDACSLTQKEYLMYLFKYNQLLNEIYK